MRKVFVMVAVGVAAMLTPSLAGAFDLCRVMALGCGDACGTDCGGNIGCGCAANCANEPACGCGDGCGVNGRQFAGDTWKCCRECGPPICRCSGPRNGCNAGCGDACGCAGTCEPGCGCEPACGCVPSGRSCSRRQCTCGGLFFASWCGRVVGSVDRFCGCTGCDGELYWNEWHNDPPRCCDPCDCHGNWVGPVYGGYRAPYDHPYNVAGRANRPSYAAKIPTSSSAVADQRESDVSQPINPFRQQTRGLTQRPSVGADITNQR
jgi:hypothetical protein